ncbi:MAG: 50S ribosomal protein L6 [Candidatus Lloydbacteria bacterium RIFCSPHIGHO2_02_FULL_51_22]|uniref:Large ribosomal subunit protein uL6 n=3 Tax=Candidatus Lloydiibacteriota TaxID=1817910 RepID=A0A1G2DB92_9BACT|nr:MAG: 50S ribosomal protein L6 [Candidatus Lloydbacteria bacterium RIFCSPHIGHO2_02_FULL_51_22]OGZ15784.1 MAG: 50S ribosomal protein L6 [Candidatus Lloydbacteria bacterium RIFCSPLOWO2_02_FULL_51_11]
MSRIGIQPIPLPEKTECAVHGGIVTIKGPLGELTRAFREGEVDITCDKNEVRVAPKRTSIFARALWGTYASHVRNMVHGVNAEFEKRLLVEGIGYRAELKGDTLVFALGFSHPVQVSLPKGIKVTVEKGALLIKGSDKELVGSFAAHIRSLKKPEPYKGKGIRYEGEVIRRKQGKKAAA